MSKKVPEERYWYLDEWGAWNIRVGSAWVWIEKRPTYCDRGHYIAKCDGVGSLDHQDAFPRYFMDLERAKLEMEEWLVWRMRSERNT